jgi:NADH:ubiquinone oxidoreductase subunit F (NADH-binding)
VRSWTVRSWKAIPIPLLKACSSADTPSVPTEGIIYVRAEYPLAITRLEIAMAQAREKGLLGKNILGSGFDFDIQNQSGRRRISCAVKKLH